WLTYRESRLGQVSFKTPGPVGRAEVFDAEGRRLVLPPFTVPREDPITLPGGWYRLRVAVPGRLSEDYDLLVEEGRHRTVTVGCNDRQLLEPRPAAGVAVGDFGMVEVVGNPATAGVLVRRLDRSGGKVRWETELNRQAGSVLADLTEGDWQRLREGLVSPSSPWMQQTPELIQPAPDLDGDGTGDLVFVVQPDFLLAMSGADGKPLWCRRLRS